ncbi:Alg9 mannosyltransferase family [Trifolium repens]|nr:Alg9 mannosyltransferase family [Trifolium repens]
MALVLHSGIYGHDLLSYTNLYSRHHLFQTVEVFWPPCMGIVFLHEERGVVDESDRYMMDPVSFMSIYAKERSHPSHIVLFDSEEQKLRSFLISFDYKEIVIFKLQLLYMFKQDSTIRDMQQRAVL